MYVFSSEDAFNQAVRDNYQTVSGTEYNLKLASPRSKIKFLNSFDKNKPQEPEPEEGGEEKEE